MCGLSVLICGGPAFQHACLKDKRRVSLEVGPHSFFQPLWISQVRVCAEKIGETDFQAHHVNQRQAPLLSNWPAISMHESGCLAQSCMSAAVARLQMHAGGGRKNAFVLPSHCTGSSF